MSKATKIWLVVAVCLVIIGCVIFAGGMTMLKWDFTKLSTTEFETKEYVINESYKNISITVDTADVVFVPSEKNSVVCHQQKKVEHLVSVNDNTLHIKINDTRKWYEYVGINFGAPKITVYLADNEYGDLFIKGSTGDVDIPENLKFDSFDVSLSTGDVKSGADVSGNVKIKTSTGDVKVEDISAEAIELSVSTGRIEATDIDCQGELSVRVTTGRIYMTDVRCNNLTSSGSTGSIKMENVVAKGKISLERDTGDVVFEKCDAGEIFVETSTGSVKGSLLSDKVFLAKTDTGRINVPSTTHGGKCEIITDTGDVDIKISDEG